MDNVENLGLSTGFTALSPVPITVEAERFSPFSGLVAGCEYGVTETGRTKLILRFSVGNVSFFQNSVPLLRCRTLLRKYFL